MPAFVWFRHISHRVQPSGATDLASLRYVFPGAVTESRSFITLDTVGNLVFYSAGSGDVEGGEDDSMGVYGEAQGKTEAPVKMDTIAQERRSLILWKGS